jgi:hypothetical protein
MADFPWWKHDKVALNPSLLEIHTVGRARIGLNTDRLPWGWRSIDHHMWKLGSIKRYGSLEAILLILERAAYQPIYICDKIGIDIVEHQGRDVSWLAQIVRAVHCEEFTGRKTILQFPAMSCRYTQRARYWTAKIGVNPKP